MDNLNEYVKKRIVEGAEPRAAAVEWYNLCEMEYVSFVKVLDVLDGNEPKKPRKQREKKEVVAVVEPDAAAESPQV